MIYCRSPQSAGEVSRALIAMGIGENFESDYVDWIEKYYGEDWSYSKGIIAWNWNHHGALPRAIQQHTIDLFNEKIVYINLYFHYYWG